MLKIRLFCAGGMSTSLLVNRVKEEASKTGEEIDIEAFPVGELANQLEGIDVCLIGPQVGYMKKKVKDICDTFGVPMDVIPMADYGRCNGKAVLAQAKRTAGLTA